MTKKRNPLPGGADSGKRERGLGKPSPKISSDPSFCQLSDLPDFKANNLSQKIDTCLLCNNPDAQIVGQFHIDPAHVHRFGGVPGKRRVVFYRVCDTCKKRLPLEMIGQIAERNISAAVDKAIQAAESAEKIPAACSKCGSSADMVHVGNGIVFATCRNCREDAR